MSLDDRKWTWGLVGLLTVFALATGCGAPLPPLPPTRSVNAAVQVAVLTPMTGELATFGETVRNGITLAFDEWNDRGGVGGGRPIAWLLEDTRCDPLEARRAAERVIAEQGVRFVVGGLCSEEAIPIARVAEERGALFIATAATHPLVTMDDTGTTRPTVFRAAFAYPYQGRAAARLALDKMNARRAAVLINPADDFVRSLADEFVATFVAGGGQVVGTGTYASRDADFSVAVAEVARAKPDVLYVPDAYPVANRVGGVVRAQGLRLTLIGCDLWDSSALDLNALGGDYFTLHYSRETPDPRAGAWAKRYLSAFALEPDTLAALGYDAADLLASAMARAAEGGLAPNDVARTLEAMEFEGVTGRWRFDRQHNPVKPVVVVQVKDGGVVFYDVVRP